MEELFDPPDRLWRLTSLEDRRGREAGAGEPSGKVIERLIRYDDPKRFDRPQAATSYLEEVGQTWSYLPSTRASRCPAERLAKPIL
jgi:hypothetical protein